MEHIEINTYALLGILRNRQKKVAEKIGMHHNTLARRLTAPERFTIKDLNAIARVCDVPLNAFVTIKEDGAVKGEDKATHRLSRPTKLGGIWKNNEVTSEDVQNARNELLAQLEGKF